MEFPEGREIPGLVLWCPAWGTQSGFLSQVQVLVALQDKIWQAMRHSAQWSSVVGQVGWVRLAKGADAPSWIQGVIRWYMNSRKGTALCIAGLGTMRQKQYEDVPGAPALRPKGRYDPRRGCLPIFQMPCHQQSDDASVCPILNSAKTQFLHPQSRV